MKLFEALSFLTGLPQKEARAMVDKEMGETMKAIEKRRARCRAEDALHNIAEMMKGKPNGTVPH